jgi:hypothetical protein
MSSQNRIGLILVAVVILSIAVLVFNRDTRASGETSIGDVSVSCGPSQRAVVQKTGAGASAQVNILCVDAGAAQSAAYATHEVGQLTPAAYAPAQAAAMPGVMYAPTRVAQATSAVPAPPVSSAVPARRAERTPSWQKRLLIVGGTSGAGAGIGALVGGKKGALIGAAIGGGGAAIVDQLKHR